MSDTKSTPLTAADIFDEMQREIGLSAELLDALLDILNALGITHDKKFASACALAYVVQEKVERSLNLGIDFCEAEKSE